MLPLHHATIIGGHGFVGRHLQARLKASGCEVWVPERMDPRLFHLDLGYVFYCAGLTADYALRPFDTVEAHVSLLNRVLRDARFESLVYLSSTRLYDSLGDVEATEDLPLCLAPGDPRHIYDLSKALGESLCRAAGQGRARVARLSCVYLDQTDSNGFLPELLRRTRACRRAPGASERPRLVVDSSPGLVRDYVHLDDVLDALILIATRGTEPVYNVASGRNVSNAQLFDRLATVAGCELVATGDAEPAPAPRIAIRRMVEEFGWRPADVLDKVSRIVGDSAAC